jgi:hypothetical protein
MKRKNLSEVTRATPYILDFIHSSSGVTSEFALLKFLDEYHSDFFEILGLAPSLFKKHFLLFYHLYLIKEEMRKTQNSLLISAVEIKIIKRNDQTKHLADRDTLSSFYLNVDNLNLSDKEISKLLQQFWLKYLAIDEKIDAIKLLGLESEKELNLAKIKKRFNRLAFKHHPDKGGKEEHFRQLKQSYNILKMLY